MQNLKMGILNQDRFLFFCPSFYAKKHTTSTAAGSTAGNKQRSQKQLISNTLASK